MTVRVQLWARLPVPPGRGLSARDAVDADVVIETEHAVWALLVCPGDVESPAADGSIDRVAMLAYAASWHAGRRPCYVGIVVSDPDGAPLGRSLIRKYQASATALHLRWPDRHHDGGNVLAFGVTTWPRLVAILSDASQSDTLGVVETTVARQALASCGRLARAA